MVTLPELETYSKEQVEHFLNLSPACRRYWNLISKKTSQQADELRIQKHTHWLECAFATLNESHPAEDVCEYWSLQTEKILQQAWESCGLNKYDVSLLAFGKLGSYELNLSSDIDIVFAKDDLADPMTVQGALKNFIKLLAENSMFGFTYRIDTDLRPGGSASPLAPTYSHFFNYYDEYTEAWNRLSFIRLRPLFGPKKANTDIVQYCQRLAFPRRLDYSVINDIKSIRGKLNYQWRKANEPLDIKFHPGGIRDIELYIHALQVIYGGRQKGLQVSSISLAMQRLKEIGAIETENYQFLYQFYWELRTLENHIHIYDDNHTYVLKKDVIKMKPEKFSEKELLANLQRSHQIIGQFFVESESSVSKTEADRQHFSTSSQKAIDDILSLRSHSLKRTQHEQIKSKILNSFLEKVEDIALDQDLAIQIFRDFIFSIKSKSSIFHLLDRHEELLDNLAWLFSISPYIGQVICRRPELLDSFVLGSVVFSEEDDLETLLENLVDYKLLGQLVSIIYFIKTSDVKDFCLHTSSQADFITDKLLAFLKKENSTPAIEILCMGKWSGHELGIESDLDMVFLTEESPTPAQIKLARRFINLITTSSRGGKLYNIDLRLKPSEASGPLLVEKARLLEYLDKHADPWQKQAYLRSRLLKNDQLFFDQHMEKLWLSKDQREDLEDIHRRLLTSPTKSGLDIKTVKGGIIHTEFCLQKHCLLQHKAPSKSDTETIIDELDFDPSLLSKIKKNYQYLRHFEQIFQISNASSSTKVLKNNPNITRVNKLLQREDSYNELRQCIEEQAELLKKLDLSH